MSGRDEGLRAAVTAYLEVAHWSSDDDEHRARERMRAALADQEPHETFVLDVSRRLTDHPKERQHRERGSWWRCIPLHEAVNAAGNAFYGAALDAVPVQPERCRVVIGAERCEVHDAPWPLRNRKPTCEAAAPPAHPDGGIDVERLARALDKAEDANMALGSYVGLDLHMSNLAEAIAAAYDQESGQ